MITVEYTPRGPRVIEDGNPPYIVSRSVSKKDSPLVALGETVDCFHMRYGRNPAFCHAGPEMKAELERHRAVWLQWIERLEYRRNCTGAVQCGDGRPVEKVAR